MEKCIASAMNNILVSLLNGTYSQQARVRDQQMEREEQAKG
jgi:hypothetical protein